VDRSGRRTTVVVWAIAGAVLGGATAAAAPARADGPGPGTSDSGDRTPGSSPTQPAGGALGNRGPGPPGPAPSPSPDPCPWVWVSSPVPAAAHPSQGGFIVGVPGFPSVAPSATFGNGRTPGAGPGTEAGLPPEPAPQGEIGGAPDATPSSGPPPAAPAVVVPRFTPPVPATGPAPNPPAAAVATSQVPAPQLPTQPIPTAELSAPPLPGPGYPAELRSDDLGRIASSALPGLAALVGVTLLGGVIGFRQARAGYLLRAAGAGRFLQ